MFTKNYTGYKKLIRITGREYFYFLQRKRRRKKGRIIELLLTRLLLSFVSFDKHSRHPISRKKRRRKGRRGKGETDRSDQFTPRRSRDNERSSGRTHAGDEKERYPSNEIIYIPRVIITILFTYSIGITGPIISSAGRKWRAITQLSRQPTRPCPLNHSESQTILANSCFNFFK